jgi:ribosomal protein S18 acetylase RimI-like enzyme
MSDLIVRPAEARDAAAVDAAGYEGALQHHRADPHLLAPPDEQSHEWSESALVQAQESGCFVAEIQARVVGYVHAIVVAESRPAFVPHRYGRIEAVAVLPAFRSRGIGTALLQRAEGWLAGQGCKIARLSVFASNRAACRLHVARGYAPVVEFMQRDIGNDA